MSGRFILTSICFFVLVVCQTVVLIPSSTIQVCSGDEVVVECYDRETTADMGRKLRWEIALRDRTVPIIELTLSDLMNESCRQEVGLKFYSKLTSTTPLIATLWTTAHSALNGAIVTCIDVTDISTVKSLIIEVNETGNNYYITSLTNTLIITIQIN